MDEDRSHRGTKSTSGDRWQIAFEFRPSRIPSQVVEFRDAMVNQPPFGAAAKAFPLADCSRPDHAADATGETDRCPTTRTRVMKGDSTRPFCCDRPSIHCGRTLD